MPVPLALPLLLTVRLAAAQGAGGAFPVSTEAFLQDLAQIELETSKGFAELQSRMGPEGLPTPDEARERVWAHLQGSGVPRVFLDEAFSDSRTRILPEVEERFKRPAEKLPYEKYRQIFINPANIRGGIEFDQDKKPLLEEMEKAYGVDGLLLVGLLGVESRYGRSPGRFSVFNALYTAVLRVPSRSAWAARELAEFLKLSHAETLEPHALQGSYAGAFGYAQFIPSSFNRYALDYDADGRREYDDWPDVMATMANYLLQNGYLPGGDFTPGSKNWWAIYAYNHSENYVKVVLELREAIRDGARRAERSEPEDVRPAERDGLPPVPEPSGSLGAAG